MLSFLGNNRSLEYLERKAKLCTLHLGNTPLVYTHHHVDHPEVFLQTMTHEDDPLVDEEPEFVVGGFEIGQIFGGHIGVKVTRLYPGKLRQVIYHLETKESDKYHLQFNTL